MSERQNTRIFTVWDYDTQTVNQYQREGDCSNCGLCCRTSIEFSVVKPCNPESLHQGGQATTGSGTWAETKRNGDKLYYRIRGYKQDFLKCKHLDENNLCGIYQDRSILCQEWPFSPADIQPFPDCSYQFTKTGSWTFEEVMRKEK